MKKAFIQSLVLVFIVFTVNACKEKDCSARDVKVGDVNLTPEVKAFMQKFERKKVIFKNAVGREKIFRDTSGFVNFNGFLKFRLNCVGGDLLSSTEYSDFVETEGIEVRLVNDSLLMTYGSKVRSKFTNTRQDTTKLFDASTFNVTNGNYRCGLGGGFIASDRGRPNLRLENADDFIPLRLITDTIIEGKRLQNVFFVNNVADNYCDSRIDAPPSLPFELYFNQTNGIVAYRSLNKVFWTFDRIE